jgi:steroid delta-isomerase-like uncharacterized protein
VSQATVEFITQLLAAWNVHDPDRAAAFYAPDYEGFDVGQAGPQRGPQGARQALVRYLRAFPDLHLTQGTTIIEGKQVALAWTARGTHQGKLMNIPPTGYTVEIRGVSLFTLEGDQIRRAEVIWDVAGLLRTLGLLPDL